MITDSDVKNMTLNIKTQYQKKLKKKKNNPNQPKIPHKLKASKDKGVLLGFLQEGLYFLIPSLDKSGLQLLLPLTISC